LILQFCFAFAKKSIAKKKQIKAWPVSRMKMFNHRRDGHCGGDLLDSQTQKSDCTMRATWFAALCLLLVLLASAHALSNKQQVWVLG
jgi:hypothetical protein